VALNLQVGTAFGKYEIVGVVGKGGMGEVYEARDSEKGRVVALKVLAAQHSKDDAYRLRFQRESRAAAKLQEPHVIPIHDWGEIDGRLYIDMRLVRGSDLRKQLKSGPLEPARAVSINGQIAAALDAAHSEGLIHRDVKPENILVTPADFAYLLDFGIAESKEDTRLTMAGSAIGTFAYMAPERFTGQRVSPAADVYSLACVLYESLTGRAPFPADSVEQVISAHMSNPPPRPSAANHAVPAPFDDVIARGMSKEPATRYGSAGEFGRAAQQALRPGSTAASEASATTPSLQKVMPITRTPPVDPGRGWTGAPMAHRPPTAPRIAYQPPYQPPAMPPLQQYQAPPPEPPYRYQARPPEPPPEPPPSRQGTRWLIPAVIGVAVVIVLAAVVAFFVFAGRGSESDNGASTTTASGAGPTSRVTTNRSSPVTTPSTTRPLATPPIFDGRGVNQEVCGSFSRAGATGFGSHSARGSARTSCAFAQSVLNAYWDQYGQPTTAPRQVKAAGTVPCPSTGSPNCSGNDFLMDCQPESDWITCTGGSDARVYIY
jgi:serine/threonine-protein kinase